MFEKLRSSPYLKILLFFVSFVWFLRFSGTALPVYFIKSGLTFPQISFGITLSIAGQLFGVLLLARLKMINRHAWYIALCLYVVTFCLYVIAPFSGFYFTAAFLSGIGSIFFYGPYGLSMFSILPRDKTGSGSATFFNLLVLVGIIAPIFSAVVAGWSMYALLGLSICFAVLAGFFTRLPAPVRVDFFLRESLVEVRNLRLPIFLHGVHESMSYIIPLFTLTLLPEFLEFGSFGTVMALVGVVVSHFVGRFSDRLKTKKKFVSLCAFALAGVTALYAFPIFKTGIVLWATLNIVNNIIDQIYDQTSVAFILDQASSLVKSIFGRELYMNSGRLVGMLVAFLGFLFPPFLPYAIIIFALAMCGFGVIVMKMKQT